MYTRFLTPQTARDRAETTRRTTKAEAEADKRAHGATMELLDRRRRHHDHHLGHLPPRQGEWTSF